MSAPISPGDWVECVDASPRGPDYVLPIHEGRLYRVLTVGDDPIDTVSLVWLEEVESEDWTLGFLACRFRPIYPGGGLLKKLMEPVPGVREACPVLTGGPMDWARQ